MATTVVAAQPGAGRITPPALQERRARPVLWSAALGAGFFALAISLWSAWILGDNFKHVGTGTTEVPSYMTLNARIWEVGGIIGFLAFLYWFTIRPWRREGRISWDGLFYLACLVPYWQSSGVNWTGYFFTWNSTLTNFGSWNCYIPFWLPPNGCRQMEAPLFAGTWFAYGLFGYAVLMCIVIGKAKQRWPNLGKVGIFAGVFAVSFVVDTVMELAYLRLGLWQYGGSPRGWLTLFDGHYYQFPLLEPLFWGASWSAVACYRYFRNDKGEGLFERGLDNVKVGTKGKAWLRFFAMTAAVNTVVLAYNLAYVPWALRSDWPDDVQKRSYFTQDLCGAGTEFACPDGHLPGLKNGGARITPDGRLLPPSGEELPAPVPHVK